MRRVLGTTLLLSGALLLTACGGSDDTATPSTSTSPAPEDVTTSPAAVKTGLEKIVTIAAGIKTDIADKTRATAGYESIEPVWSTIEGTVKQNDSNAYLALEDAFAVLKNAAEKADATLAASGSEAVSKTVSAYLAKYPA
jgi:hypothetical protein